MSAFDPNPALQAVLTALDMRAAIGGLIEKRVAHLKVMTSLVLCPSLLKAVSISCCVGDRLPLLTIHASVPLGHALLWLLIFAGKHPQSLRRLNR